MMGKDGFTTKYARGLLRLKKRFTNSLKPLSVYVIILVGEVISMITRLYTFYHASQNTSKIFWISINMEDDIHPIVAHWLTKNIGPIQVSQTYWKKYSTPI